MHDSQPPTPSALERLASQSLAYVSTIGRRSGEPHRIEIWFAVADGDVYLLSGGRESSDWVKNLRANPRVSIEIGSETFQGVAELIVPESPDDARARQLLVQKYRKANELDDWARTSLPIVIRFTTQEQQV